MCQACINHSLQMVPWHWSMCSCTSSYKFVQVSYVFLSCYVHSLFTIIVLRGAANLRITQLNEFTVKNRKQHDGTLLIILINGIWASSHNHSWRPSTISYFHRVLCLPKLCFHSTLMQLLSCDAVCVPTYVMYRINN